MKKTIAFGITVIVSCVLFAGCGLNGSKKTTINLEEFTKIEISGYDGFGTADMKFDYDALMNLVWDGTLQHDMTISNFSTGVEYSYENSEALKNGDTIDVVATYNDNIAETLGLKVENTTFTITVNGLKETTLIDFEENTDVVFSGFNGYGSVELSYKSDMDIGAKYLYEQSTSLKNGDTVDVEVTFDEKRAEIDGIIAEKTKFTVTVAGLGELTEISLSDLITAAPGNVASTFYGIIVRPTDTFPENMNIHKLPIICEEYPNVSVSQYTDRGVNIIMLRFSNEERLAGLIPPSGETITITVTDSGELGRVGYKLKSDSEQFVLG